MDGVVREMINITDEMAATDAKNVKAMHSSVDWFSSPSCALIYQCSVRRPPLVKGLRHRRKVPAVTRC
eukprot:3081556-Pleurochrysis_carterae.AAC.1